MPQSRLKLGTSLGGLVILKRKVSTLEEKLALACAKRMALVPAEYGFASMEDFLETLRRLRRPIPAALPVLLRRGRPRSRLTPEKISQVKLLIEGGESVRGTALQAEISVPSVYILVKRLGLTVRKAA